MAADLYDLEEEYYSSINKWGFIEPLFKYFNVSELYINNK